MIITATILVSLGLVISLLGLKLFKILLPIIGFISGIFIGFSGTQSIFGTGAVSTTLAVLIGVMMGILLAILSFIFFRLAILLFIGFIGASAVAFLGVSLGLNEDGFLVFMLGLAGFIIAISFAAKFAVGMQLIIALTSFIGVAYVLAGIMLITGNVSLDDLNNNGIVATIVKVVDQSFIWLLVWIGASLLAMQAQIRLAIMSVMQNMFEYDESSYKTVSVKK